jgi:hypothetical protein
MLLCSAPWFAPVVLSSSLLSHIVPLLHGFCSYLFSLLCCLLFLLFSLATCVSAPLQTLVAVSSLLAIFLSAHLPAFLSLNYFIFSCAYAPQLLLTPLCDLQ